jgi:hypothetical protein
VKYLAHLGHLWSDEPFPSSPLLRAVCPSWAEFRLLRRLRGMGILGSYVSSGTGVGFVCDPAGGSTELLIVFISRANNGLADGYGGSDIDTS